MVERVKRRASFRSRQIGYPLLVRGQVCRVQSPLPCFAPTVLSRDASLPSPGSWRAQFPDVAGTMKALRLPARASWFLMVSVTGPTLLLVRARRSAPDGAEVAVRPGSLFTRRPFVPGFCVMDASGISQVSWRSIPCLCPAPRPRPSQQDLAFCRSCRCCLRLTHTEGPSGHQISRLNTRLQHPLPPLHEQRCRCPCKARFRLAGCAFAGREFNPLDRYERFQVYILPPFQDFAWRKHHFGSHPRACLAFVLMAGI